MRIDVIRSAVINAPIVRVWAVLRDFGGHHRWHPAVTEGRVENDTDGDVVGCVRRYHLADQSEIREQLLRHSDRDRSCAYSVLDSPLPLFDNITTLSLKPITDDGATFVHWHSRFRTPAEKADEMKIFVSRNIFEAGFTGLRSFLAEKADASEPAAFEPETIPPTAGESLPSREIVIGDPGVFRFQGGETPAPGTDQVRIRQSTIGVTLTESNGVEGVGEIIDAGDGVNGLFPGDRVAYVSRAPGSYTDIRLVEADSCLPLPEGLTDLEASILFKGVSAGILLERVFRAAPGKSILVQSASGGLGHILCQWAASLDLTVIGTVSTVEQAKFIREKGCDYPIVMDNDRRLSDEVMRVTNGRGVDYFTYLGGVEGINEALVCLSRFGRLAAIGPMDGSSIQIDSNLMKKRSLTISAPDFFDYLEDRVYFQRIAHRLFSKIRNKTITPAIEPFSLDRAAEARQKLKSREVIGALALTPGR